MTENINMPKSARPTDFVEVWVENHPIPTTWTTLRKSPYFEMMERNLKRREEPTNSIFLDRPLSEFKTVLLFLRCPWLTLPESMCVALSFYGLEIESLDCTPSFRGINDMIDTNVVSVIQKQRERFERFGRSLSEGAAEPLQSYTGLTTDINTFTGGFLQTAAANAGSRNNYFAYWNVNERNLVSDGYLQVPLSSRVDTQIPRTYDYLARCSLWVPKGVVIKHLHMERGTERMVDIPGVMLPPADRYGVIILPILELIIGTPYGKEAVIVADPCDVLHIKLDYVYVADVTTSTEADDAQKPLFLAASWIKNRDIPFAPTIFYHWQTREFPLTTGSTQQYNIDFDLVVSEFRIAVILNAGDEEPILLPIVMINFILASSNILIMSFPTQILESWADDQKLHRRKGVYAWKTATGLGWNFSRMGDVTMQLIFSSPLGAAGPTDKIIISAGGVSRRRR